MKKSFLLLMLLPFLQGCFPKVISSFYSREYCSCRFIENRDDQYCHWYASNFIPVFSREIDEKNKKITSSSLGFTTSASFINSKVGCQIIE